MSGRTKFTLIALLVALALPMLSGCFGPPAPTNNDAAYTGAAGATSVNSAFRTADAAAKVATADELPSSNPFGYENPLR